MKKTSILIVDDHPIVRDGLKLLLDKNIDLYICGQAEDTSQAMAVIEKQKPDLVIIDLSLIDGNGLELIKNIRVLYPHLLILVMSMHDENIYAERSVRAGANGYIMKCEASENIIKAIRKIIAGELYLSKRIRNKILEKVLKYKQTDCSPLELLSDREIEVFQLIAEGLKRSAVAKKLNASVSTIDTHYAHIKKKLGLKNSNQLTKFAMNFFLNESKSIRK